MGGDGATFARWNGDRWFGSGVIYEWMHVARGTGAQGSGLAAIRDLVCHLKHDSCEMDPVLGPDGTPIATRVMG